MTLLRHYGLAWTRWQRSTPMLGAYVYCAANPVKYVDPDGRKIIYAKGSSPSFKQSVQTAVNHLYKCGASKIVNELIKNPNIIITIKEETRDVCGSYSGKDNVLKWNPKLGCLTDEGIVVSPITILNHEFDHALQENRKHREAYKTGKFTVLVRMVLLVFLP